MKSCIQVLEILISKADEDIIEHEEELMDLLSQLSCTDKVFSDMFSMSLRSKIDFLDTSIRKLKNGAESEEFLSTNREPAESIYDILKSLFSDYIQKKDLQFADNTGTGSSSNSNECADKQKKQFGSSSNANQIKKVKTVNIIPVEKEPISWAIVKVKEEMTNYHHNIPMPLCWGSTKKTNREVRKSQIKSPIIMKKDILLKRTPKCSSVCLKGPKPSLETQGKLKHQLSIVKSQIYNGSMTLATVPYQEPSEETNAVVPCVRPHEEPNAIVPYVEPHKEPNAKQLITKELDSPPGYPSPQSPQNQIILRPRTPCSTHTYQRRKQSNSQQLQKSSSSFRALVVGNPFDRAETYSKLYKEDYYTLPDLRAIAKQQNLKGYYKLRKAELAHALGIKVIEGRRKQPKRRRHS
ncbi:uncharacterized protein LOC143568431 [Bidens hawaiensis]|uniref:uncharacterized protein LOC143568431 n=1 Tax=Bidens hawaiensis TaxID=980011 RepID=UPI00404A0C00